MAGSPSIHKCPCRKPRASHVASAPHGGVPPSPQAAAPLHMARRVHAARRPCAPHLLRCSYVRNLTAELGTMRMQLEPLPFIMPAKPSVRAMCTNPCGSSPAQRRSEVVAACVGWQPATTLDDISGSHPRVPDHSPAVAIADGSIKASPASKGPPRIERQHNPPHHRTTPTPPPAHLPHALVDLIVALHLHQDFQTLQRRHRRAGPAACMQGTRGDAEGGGVTYWHAAQRQLCVRA